MQNDDFLVFRQGRWIPSKEAYVAERGYDVPCDVESNYDEPRARSGADLSEDEALQKLSLTYGPPPLGVKAQTKSDTDILNDLLTQAAEKKDPYVNPKDLVGSKKVPFWVVPDTALMHLAMGMRDGGYKYDPYNFRKTAVVANIYTDAIRRHLLCWMAGEEYAEDSGVHHLGHLMACAAILLDTQAHGKLHDNRSKSPATVALLKALCKQIEEEERDPETGKRIVP